MKKLVAIWACMLATAFPSFGQRYGQWSWQGKLSFGQRSYQYERSSATTTPFEQRRANLSLDLKGYVFSPAFGTLDLGLDLGTSKEETSRHLSRHFAGYRLNLSLLPGGFTSFRLFANRKQFDYSGLTRADLAGLGLTPEGSQTLGGRLRFRSGPFAGLLLGYETTATEFLEAGTANHRESRGFAGWSGGSALLQHHLTLEDRNRSYKNLNYSQQDFSVSYDHHGTLGSSWRLDHSSAWLRRNWDYNGMNSSFQSAVARQSAERAWGQRTDASLSYAFAWVDGTGLPTSSHSLTARVRYTLTPRLSAYSFVSYGYQQGPRSTAQVPHLGLGLNWARRMNSFSLSLAATGSAGTMAIREDKRHWRDTFSAFSVGGEVAAGEPHLARQELSFFLARNQLSQLELSSSTLPDIIPISATGVEDLQRVRWAVQHLNGRWQAMVFFDWQRRENRQRLMDMGFTEVTKSANLQLRHSKISLKLTKGSAVQEASQTQRVSYSTAGLFFTPWRYLRIHGSYRADQRSLVMQPSLRSHRWEAGLQWDLGALAVRAQAFRTQDALSGQRPRENRGFEWTIQRSFGGWLPWVSAPVRSGVVR